MSEPLTERPETTPLTLLQLAVAQNADVDKLERLMALQERWEASQAKKAYQESMTLAQQEMTGVIKDKKNAHTKSMYAALESVQEMARPVYTKHGFSLSWGQEPPPREGWLRFVCTVRHKSGHTEKFQGDYPQDGFGAKGNANMNAVQGVVSSGSYVQRDMLRLIFNVTIAGADEDGNVLGLTLNPEQVRLINEGLEDCREAGTPVNFERFLEWLLPKMPKEQRNLAFVPQAKFTQALLHLNGKKRAKKKEGANQ